MSNIKDWERVAFPSGDPEIELEKEIERLHAIRDELLAALEASHHSLMAYPWYINEDYGVKDAARARNEAAIAKAKEQQP